MRECETFIENIVCRKPAQRGDQLPKNTSGPELRTAALALGLALIAVVMVALSACRPVATVTVGSATWSVETAITPEEHYQGLSGRTELPQGEGMLFIFDHEQELKFWMFDMNFPIDIIWIDSSCRVIDATLNADPPAPGQSPVELPRFSPQAPAKYVLEVNAGEFEDAGLEAGDIAVFGGELSSLYGC